MTEHRIAERLVLASLCAAMTAIAFGYSLRDALGPGAGFFPFWLGVLGALLSLALLLQSWRGREGGEAVRA